MLTRENLMQSKVIKLAILLLAILLLQGFTAACQASVPTEIEPTEIPPGFPTPDPEILAACLEQGGRWEMLGFSGPGCNLPTSDGGKTCTESTECESACLGDPDLVMIEDEFGFLLPNHEKVEELNAIDGEQSGLCSAWQENFGCNVWLQEGSFVVICVD